MTLTAKIKKGALLITVGTSLAACDALQITGGPLDIGAAQANNLLNHGGFEGGFGAWRACSDPQLVNLQSNDTHTISSAMLDAGGCLYQTQPAQANDNMAVSCSARKATANWASLTFGYLDADYQPLKSVEAPIPDANFTNVSATLRAPADTAFVEVMIYAEDGAAVDDCELINTQPNQPFELLINSYFEEGMNGWQSCNHGTAMADSGTATIDNSCISQKFTTVAGTELQLTCDGVKLDDKHAAMALGFLDDNSQPIEMRETPISTQEGLYPTIAMTAPVASTYAQVMVYSEGVANLNSCSLQLPANEE